MTLKFLALQGATYRLCGVSKTFGDWYQKTNKTEDTNKLTLLSFKIIAILQTHCWQRSLTAVTRCWIAAAVRQQSNNV
jgi:hypothetical protein